MKNIYLQNKILKWKGVGLGIQYKGCPMASDAFNVVHVEHFLTFRQICWMFLKCAMSNPAHGRTFSYSKFTLLAVIRWIKPLSHFLSLALFLCGRLLCWWWCGWRTTSFLIQKTFVWKIWNVQDFSDLRFFMNLFCYDWWSTMWASTWFLLISILFGSPSISHFSMEQMTSS